MGFDRENGDNDRVKLQVCPATFNVRQREFIDAMIPVDLSRADSLH